MTSILRKGFLGFALSLFSGLSLAQLVVVPMGGAVTANSLASSLLSASSGITINSATYTGAPGASGTFSTTGAPIIGIASGILLTSGAVGNVVGPNNNSSAGTDNGLPGDAQLTALAGAATHDASILTIDFTPTGNTIQFSYVFGSEEYNEFVNAGFNDVFGFFVNGVNKALIPSTSTPVAIDNINCGNAAPGTAPPGPGTNCSLFVNNDPAAHNTQLDGYTTVLSFTAAVNPGVPNTLKIAIADTSDGILDSAVFIGGGTLASCGGVGQPPCGTPPPVGPPSAAVPTLGEWALVLLVLLTGLAGAYTLRRRR